MTLKGWRVSGGFFALEVSGDLNSVLFTNLAVASKGCELGA